MQVDRLLPVAEVCTRLAISRAQFYILAAEGRIGAFKHGSRTVVPEAELRRYIAALPPAEFRKPPSRAA